jgi:hypothetical protein
VSDVVLLLALAGVVALVGIGAGILVAGPLDRFVSREDEELDDAERARADPAAEVATDRPGSSEAPVENEEDT